MHDGIDLGFNVFRLEDLRPIGIYGLDLNEAIAQVMDLPKDTQGVLVEQVEVGSPADKAGVQGSFKPFTLDGEVTLSPQ